MFVTNGGFGATQQALAAGTPVVVAGVTDDKPFVAARVAARGVGRDFGTASPTPAQVREAVLGLLADGAVRANVERLAAEYAGYNVVDRIERLLLTSVRRDDPLRGRGTTPVGPSRVFLFKQSSQTE